MLYRERRIGVIGKNENRKRSQKTTATVQIRNDGGLEHCSSGGNGKMYDMVLSQDRL